MKATKPIDRAKLRLSHRWLAEQVDRHELDDEALRRAISAEIEALQEDVRYANELGREVFGADFRGWTIRVGRLARGCAVSLQNLL